MRQPCIVRPLRLLVVMDVIVSATLAPAPAEADCARPDVYSATVSGNTVTIEPLNDEGRGCPDPSGMLRQNVSTGQIVKLADFCGQVPEQDGTGFQDGAPYIDECVPAGEYRYGFATPYQCLSACSADYFTDATVADQLPTGCQLSQGDSGPTAATTVPWGGTIKICALEGGSSGCSVANGRGTGAVFLVQGLALLVGAALMFRRKTHR